MYNLRLTYSICCFILILSLQQFVDCQALISEFGQNEQESVNNAHWTESEELETILHPFDNFLNNIIPPFLGLPSRDLDGTDSQFRAEAIGDNSNDDAVFMSPVSYIKNTSRLIKLV